MGLNSSMGTAANRNPEGVSSKLASANTFFVLVKNSVRNHDIFIFIHIFNFSEDDSDIRLPWFADIYKRKLSWIFQDTTEFIF